MHWSQGISGWISFTWWALLILIAVLITRYFVKRNKHPKESKALDILKERFAKGDIDKEEFEEKKNHLSE